MGMSAFYGTTDEGRTIATIHRALELGVTFLDTAQIYGPHTNEELVGRAVKGGATRYVIATKFGAGWTPDPGGMSMPRRLARERPRFDRGSLERLGTDHVDLYYQHRIDPNVPIEETVGAMAELVSEARCATSG